MKSLLKKPSPVIGILTKSVKDEGVSPKGYKEIIEPKYLNILRESIVIPISLYTPYRDMKNIMGKINGLCLPGGFSNIWRIEGDKRIESDYTKAANILLELALDLNKKGIYLPVLGICLGFELMTSYISKDLSLVQPCIKCSDYNTTLRFTEEGKRSKLYKECFNKKQLEDLEKKHLSYNYHSYMVDPKRFVENEKLSKFFNMVSTSPACDDSFEFVSTIEGREVPFYAFQHHPEWCFYDFYDPKLNVICNNETKDIGDSIRTFFLNECKKNNNTYEDKEELERKMLVNEKLEKVKTKGYIYFLN